MTRKLTRRTVLKLGCASGVTLVGGSALAGTSLAATGIWSRSTYVPLVGQSFTIRGYSSPAQLVRIDDLPGAPVGSDRAFALVFRMSGDAGALPNGLRRLTNPSLGSFSMFLSPALSKSSDTPLVAVINRTHG